jgi:hypothetical protein
MRQLIVFFIILLNFEQVHAHVGHNKNLQNLSFDIYRNGAYAGFHTIDFNWVKDGSVEVKNVIEFGVKKLGITFYKYQSVGTETYDAAGKLVNFNSNTDDNGKPKFCNIDLKKDKYEVNGTKFKGEFKKPFLISSYWNHDIVTVPYQLSGITCKVTEQKVSFIKEEDFKKLDQTFKTRVFDIKGKDLDTQVWFDQKTRMIVHQVLHRKGKWEYKLKSYKLNK